MKHLAVGSALLASLSLGCLGDEGPPNPVPMETPDRPDPAPQGTVVRTVETRNPMATQVGNLLVDGGFELSIVIQGAGGQNGWLTFGGGASGGYLRGATGGVCRSGLRCGWLETGALYFGQGTSAGMIASVYAKPPPGVGCSGLRADILNCNNFEGSARLIPESEEPSRDGWCFYRARLAEQKRASCMLLENGVVSGEPILVDDAALVPETGQVPLSSLHAIPETKFRPIVGERRERVRALIEWKRGQTPIGAPFQRRPQWGPE